MQKGNSDSATGIPYDTYEIKIGDSFAHANQKPSKRSSNAPSSSASEFHTLRYDFKPQSVAGEQETYIGGLIIVVVPNQNLDNLTVYKGSKNPIAGDKECLLIFDQETKQLTLERLSSNFTIKKTRGNDDGTNEALKAQIQRIRSKTGRHLKPVAKVENDERAATSSPSSHSSGTSSNDENERKEGSGGNDSDSDEDALALESMMAPLGKTTPAAPVNVMEDLIMSDESSSDSD
uniref:Ell-associated factor Eaf n=1 Tax=Ditylenchus dipsaci TaxID=166011 RepID=A0A915DY40_9BILA